MQKRKLQMHLLEIEMLINITNCICNYIGVSKEHFWLHSSEQHGRRRWWKQASSLGWEPATLWILLSNLDPAKGSHSWRQNSLWEDYGKVSCLCRVAESSESVYCDRVILQILQRELWGCVCCGVVASLLFHRGRSLWTRWKFDYISYEWICHTLVHSKLLMLVSHWRVRHCAV